MTSSAVLTAGGMVNVALGFVFQLILARRLGVSSITDVYSLATSLPTLAATVALAAVPGVLVPAVTKWRGSGRVVVPVASLMPMTVAVAAFVVAVMVGSPLIADAMARHASDQVHHNLVVFLLITAPSIVIAWLAAIMESIAVANENFLSVALSSAANGAGLLALAALWVWTDASAVLLAVAFVGGYLCQLTYLSLTALRGTTLSAARRAGPPITRALTVVLLTAVISKAQPVAERVIGASFPGGPAILSYAAKLSQSLLLVSTLGLALIALPTISRLVSEGRRQEAAVHALRAAYSVACLSAPVCVAFFAAAPQVVDFVYAGGRFSPADFHAMSTVLRISAIGIYTGAITGPIVNFLYATMRYRLAASVAITSAVLGALLSWVLSTRYQLSGIAVGSSAIFTANLIVFLAIVARDLPARALRRFVVSVAVVTVACTAVCALIWVLVFRTANASGRGFDFLQLLTLVGACAAAVALAWRGNRKTGAL